MVARRPTDSRSLLGAGAYLGHARRALGAEVERRCREEVPRKRVQVQLLHGRRAREHVDDAAAGTEESTAATEDRVVLSKLSQASKNRDLGWQRAMLVGDEPYYGRFGFHRLEGVEMPPPTNPARVLGVALAEGAWDGVTGQVTRCA